MKRFCLICSFAAIIISGVSMWTYPVTKWYAGCTGDYSQHCRANDCVCAFYLGLSKGYKQAIDLVVDNKKAA